MKIETRRFFFELRQIKAGDPLWSCELSTAWPWSHGMAYSESGPIRAVAGALRLWWRNCA